MRSRAPFAAVCLIVLVAALTAGYTTMMPIIYSSLVGFVVAIPVAWVIAKKIRENA